MATNKTATTFSDIIRAYETAYISNDYSNELQTLAKACTLTVLKKLYELSGHKIYENLRNGIGRDVKNIELITHSDSDYTEKVLNDTFSEGCDFINDAVVALLEETNKAHERSVTLEPGFMEIPYTVNNLKKRVYIKNEGSIKGCETAETTPLHEVYKSIRRCVYDSREVQIATNNKYLYFEDVANISGSAECAGFQSRGGYSFKTNESIYSSGLSEKVEKLTEIQVDTDIDKLIENLNLTERQTIILKYRLDGYGYKAIATAMGISVGNIRSQLVCMQKKAIEAGLKKSKGSS